MDINIDIIENNPTKSYVVEGATLKCSLGSAVSSLRIPIGHGVLIKGKKQANISDMKPLLNISSFCSCTIPSTPPRPCVPAITLNWLNGKDDVFIGNYIALLNKSTLICSFGGIIEIVDDGQ